MNDKLESETRVAGDQVADDAPFACFNCDHVGGGLYKPHEGEARWFLGLEESGQANYACEDCKDALFCVRPVRTLQAQLR